MNLCVLFHTSVFLFFWCGVVKFLYIYFPISVLGPEALHVIRIVDFLIASCCDHFIPELFLQLCDVDQSRVANSK